MRTLDQLAAVYGTDKGTKPVPSGLTPKGYTTVYDELLRSHPVKTVLEIGIFRGASLHMWRDFFPGATIVGLDQKPMFHLESEHIKIFYGDQGDRLLLEDIAKIHAPFDLVVDDGSHIDMDQLTSFSALFQHVSPGGYYAIEDLHAATSIDLSDINRLLNTYPVLNVVISPHLAIFRRKP